MTTIKVIYKNVARRITVQKETQWTDLAQTLSGLFGLSESQQILLAYNDIENDTITLNSTAELHGVIDEGITKFKLIDADNLELSTLSGTEIQQTPDTMSVRSGSDPFTFIEPVVEIEIPKEQDYATTVEEAKETQPPEYEPKGKEKAETPGESSTKAEPSNEQQQEQTPFENIIDQWEKLCEQFQGVLDNNPELVATAKSLMDQIARNLATNIDDFATCLNNAAQQCQQGERQPHHPFGFGHHFDPSMRPPFAHPFYAGRFGCSTPQRKCHQFGGHWGQWHPNRQDFCQRGPHHQQGLSPDEMKSKIEQLNGMGFYQVFSEERLEDLLRRYNGNIERVVEVLLQRQQ